MAPNLRSLLSISLSEKQRTILEHIVQGHSTTEINLQTGFTESSIKAIRRNLLELFNANSNIHLITLAILEADFFKILGRIRFKRIDIDSDTLDVVLLTLQGYKNREIIEALQFPKRKVEYLKAKYRKTLGIERDSDFVKKSIEAGLLVVFPVHYHFKDLEMFSTANKKYKIESDNVKIVWKSQDLNSTGFVYIDYLNRFCFLYRATFRDPKQMDHEFVLAMMLSDFDERAIQRNFISEFESVQVDLELFGSFFRKKRMDRMLFNLTSSEKLKLNILPAPSPSFFTKGQIILVGYLVRGYTEEQILKAMKLHQETFKDQLDILFLHWNSHSLLGVYLTFLHLDYLKLEAYT